MKNVRFRRSCSGTCFLNSGTEILIWSVRKQSENIISKRRSQQEKAMDTVATCLRTGRIMQRCCEAIWKRKNEQEPHSTETVFPQYFQQIMHQWKSCGDFWGNGSCYAMKEITSIIVEALLILLTCVPAYAAEKTVDKADRIVASHTQNIGAKLFLL